MQHIFACERTSIREGLDPTARTGYPKAGVCTHGTNYTYLLGAIHGRGGIAYNSTSACLRMQTAGMTTFPSYLHEIL